VSIDIAVTTAFGSTPANGTPVLAFLTDSFLAGTTVANEIAHTSFTIPPGSAPNTVIPIFTGLVLGPGQYFLTVYAPTSGNAGGWCVATNPPTISAATDVTEDYTYLLNGYAAYPPAGGFLNYWNPAEFSIQGVPGTPPPNTATIQSLSLSSASVMGGGSVTATVTLSGPAPAGGVGITIQDSPAILQFTSPVTVPAGQTSATFAISAPNVTSATSVTLTATLSGVTLNAALTVNPATATNPFQDNTFDIYGTLTISGQSVSVEVQTMAVSDWGAFATVSNFGASTTILLSMLFDEQVSTSGNTVTYNGVNPVSIY
jgi:hypothetical protein